jgi:diguanylate cyclase (GGDEF)-like protein
MDKSKTRVPNWIHIVSEDQVYSHKLSQQISHFGYQLQVLRDISQLEIILAEHSTVAVLIDVSRSLGNEIKAKLYNLVREKRERIEFPVIIFISDWGDQQTRIEAIRAGGDAFFVKPINVVSLIDKIDALRFDKNLPLSKVQIIVPQTTLASYYQLIIKRGGYTTDIVSDTSRILEHLDEFQPDLILLDISMPMISSIEILKMIRQIEAFISIPVIFLMSEADEELQTNIMQLGGDDFLLKPVRANHLISSIQNRLERSRSLRGMMIRDGLTGLLNHTNFREQLNQVVSRSKRRDSELALAMIDLDKFKSVNDSFGHAVGDSVLKSLSRILQQRLRSSDVIGRYGGEEFGAALLDVSTDQAVDILDEIRSQFSKVQHFSPIEGHFTVTFSCGIATFPLYSSAIALNDAADRALYAAKASGRNRIVVANHESP